MAESTILSGECLKSFGTPQHCPHLEICSDGLSADHLAGKESALATHRMLGSLLRVHITDGRVLIGAFKVHNKQPNSSGHHSHNDIFMQCLDGLGNLVLSDTEVWRSDEGTIQSLLPPE